MANALKGVSLDISGMVDGSGATDGAGAPVDTYNVKVNRIKFSNSMHVPETSGVGDAGEATYVGGKATRRFSFSGYATVAGTPSDSERLNVGAMLYSTLAGTLTVQLNSTSRQVIGNVFIFNLRIQGGYETGAFRVSGQGVFTGALNGSTNL